MGNCKDCKWWEREDGIVELPRRLCNAINSMRALEGNGERAIVYDADGMIGWLLTHPDFGCVLFSANQSSYEAGDGA